MPLLPKETAFLFQLPVRFPDLRAMLSGKQMGHNQRPNLGLSRLRPGQDDVLIVKTEKGKFILK